MNKKPKMKMKPAKEMKPKKKKQKKGEDVVPPKKEKEDRILRYVRQRFGQTDVRTHERAYRILQELAKQDADAKWNPKSLLIPSITGQNLYNVLGYMAENAIGTEKDDATAAKYYTKAAGQGDWSAEFNLGYMYELGRGVGLDIMKAITLYRKSAKAAPETFAKQPLLSLGNLLTLYKERVQKESSVDKKALALFKERTSGFFKDLIPLKRT